MKRHKTNYWPILTSILVLLTVIGVVWMIPRMGILEDSADQEMTCAKELTGNLMLENPLTCRHFESSPDTAERYMLRIATDNVILDCNGQTLTGQGDIGVLVDKAKNVTIRNCPMIGFDYAVKARHADKLVLENIEAKVGVIGFEIAQSRDVKVVGDILAGVGEKARAGIDSIGCERIVIEKCVIENFTHSGINFYSTREFQVTNNNIRLVNDTGVGFFQRENHGPTQNGVISENRISDIKNVGAFEVMEGVMNLEFSKNTISNAHSALFVYKKNKTETIQNIAFSENEVTGTFGAFSLSDCENVIIKKNRVKNIAGGMVTIENAADIKVLGNRFVMAKGGVVIKGKSDKIAFSGNLIDKGFGKLLAVEKLPRVYDFSRNYWNGCPQRANFNGISFPKDINPILISFEGDAQGGVYTMVDKDKDGADDNECRDGS